MHQAGRPRERLTQLGPRALNNPELITILLRVGVPGENAVQVGQRLPSLWRTTIPAMTRLPALMT
jgi:DNA repair protein RadC